MSSSISGGLTASSLSPDFTFNWVFLVELIVCGVITLFFLFYFNRFFATVVSYGVRSWTWHKYRVYIDIQALQFSLLGGRVFFKGLRYHGNNETILIHNGFVTWRYWLRRVRDLDLDKDEHMRNPRSSLEFTRTATEGTEKTDENTRAERCELGTSQKLPCRLNVSLRGVEWFVYNRTPAYDSIIDRLTQQDTKVQDIGLDAPQDTNHSISLKRRGHGNLDRDEAVEFSKSYSRGSERTSKLSTSSEKRNYSPIDAEGNSKDYSSASLEISDEKANRSEDEQKNLLLRFLPIHIECTKAAIVVGNENTKSVLITKAERFSGDIDASVCKYPDKYKQLINLELEHPVVQIKPNDDYKEDQTSAASRIKLGSTERKFEEVEQVPYHSLSQRYRRRLWHNFQYLVPYFRSSVESFSITDDSPMILDSDVPNGKKQQWQGLSRYLDDNEQDDKARWSAVEYATVTTIIDCQSATLSYYWDIPGRVPPSYGHNLPRSRKIIDINGDTPPDWGLDLFMRGSMINYGPWADRQRTDLQRVFFPSLCKNSSPARQLKPGETRVATVFKLYVQFETQTTFRIPIREESKNWKWKTRSDDIGQRMEGQKQRQKDFRKGKIDKGSPGPEIRPFGWFDITVAENASIRYTSDMVAGAQGYANILDLELPSAEITTSVNHGLLWRSVDQRVSCDLSNPLKWNGLHEWKFDISCEGLELFILREHIFLMIDLVDDWASGPPPEYLTFSPMRYGLNLKFTDFKLYFNVNDSNIINNPSDFDDNTFLILSGKTLKSDLCIPLDRFRPSRNVVTFIVDATAVTLNLHVPPWNTYATFLSSTEIGHLKSLTLDGSYNYCAITASGNTDTIFLDLHGRQLQLHTYGFLIRYFLKIKDNYFGEDIHFKTLEEYQEVLHAKQEDSNASIHDVPPHKKINDLDVILKISGEDSSAILPANLYSAEEHIRLKVARWDADLRFTNYYMDMHLGLSPLAFFLGSEEDNASARVSSMSNAQLFIDGIDISGNRLFGLPPTEPTYLCQWDFDVGSVTGECSTVFLGRFASGAKAFVFSFDDDENSLKTKSETVLHDVIFLRATIERVHIWTHVEEAAFLLSLSGVELKFNDWAGPRYSKKLELEVPTVVIACVDAESASRHRTRTNIPIETHAHIRTSITLTKFDRKLGFTEARGLQQKHVRQEDSRTHRAEFLIHKDLSLDDDEAAEGTEPPYMCLPAIPPPILQADVPYPDDVSILTKPSARSSRRFVRRKSSFLSASSSRSSVMKVERRLSIAIDERDRSRSRSTQPRIRPTGPHRDLSVSTGRHSSFHSAIGDQNDQEAMPLSHLSFPSAFISPYFPLDSIDPDDSDLPTGPVDEEQADILEPDVDFAGVEIFDEDVEYDSIILEFRPGIRAYFNHGAVRSVATLLEKLQATTPNNMLDNLQVDAIKDLLSLRKQRLMIGKITDLNVRMPALDLRYNNSSAFESYNSSGQEFDQYDLILRGLSLMSRSSSAVRNLSRSSSTQNATSLHVRLKSAELSAKERLSGIENPQAAIHSRIDDGIFWMANSDIITGNLDVGGIRVSTNSRKVGYLASLVHRTSHLVAITADTFTSLERQRCDRLKLFTFLVATRDHYISDPLFLTRPSYVLRSATNHLRSSDSWKGLARLRQLYSSLSPEMQHDIASRVLSDTELCPNDAQQQVVARFHNWRSWDLENLPECEMMKKIYGDKSHHESPEASHAKPAYLALRLGLASFVLDPGPKQNEVSLRNLTNNIGIVPPEANGAEAHTTAIQVYCGDISIDLNWELSELVENIVKLYKPAQPESRPLSAALSASNSDRIHEQEAGDRLIHVVVVTDKISLTLDTINLRATSISEGLKASFINKASQSNSNCASFVIASEAATSRLRHNFQDISLSQLRHPTLAISLESGSVDGNLEKSWKVAGKCQELSYTVGQSPLGLLEVIDLVIGDEVAHIHKLSKLMTRSGTLTALKRSSITPKTVQKINIGLFLDKYHISIPLLHSLKYHISGVIARVSISARDTAEYIFDFDVKDHSHNIQTQARETRRDICLLQMPPTNGRIITHMTPEENNLAIFASVEPINIDAAEIHSLLSAINRPEISRMMNEFEHRLRGIQGHIDQMFETNKKQVKSSPESSKDFTFDAHLTLAGLAMFTDAPHTQKEYDTARLALNLGSIQLQAANKLEGTILEFPEVRIQLRHVKIELSKVHRTIVGPCGDVSFAAFMSASTDHTENGVDLRSYHVRSDSLSINLFAETASTVIDLIGNLQTRIRDLDISREVQYLNRLRKPTNPRIMVQDDESGTTSTLNGSTTLFSSIYSFELLNVQTSWIVGSLVQETGGGERENLVISLRRVDLSTRKENSARLTIEDLQLQMVPSSHDKLQRSYNSALLPEIIFNVAYISMNDTRRLAFQAVGKPVDLRLTSHFIIPAAGVKKSIESAALKVRAASEMWRRSPKTEQPNGSKRKPFFGKKRMESLLVDADFAGAVVHIQGRRSSDFNTVGEKVRGSRIQSGKYGQFSQDDPNSTTVLHTPGLAWKVEFKDNGLDDPSLNAEIKISASSNTLHPTVVPLVMDISSSVKSLVGNNDSLKPQTKLSPQKLISQDEDSNILGTDPTAVLGRTRLNLGIRICRQEFCFSCQPIARVQAMAKFDDIYVTISTVRSVEHGNFFALSAAFSHLKASVQHVYSRESTGSFDVDSIVLSLMNSKHVSGVSGLSTILKISPMKVLINAKQLQDFLLFRDIWIPAEIRQSSRTSTPVSMSPQSQSFLVQRYHQVAATGAFPWNATVAISQVEVQLDLGQSIGKSIFMISSFWVSTKKDSDWEQNLCLGFDKIGVESTGRLSGFITLQDFKVRTSIRWPEREKAVSQTPLIQGSLGFSQFRVKIAFDYQAFLVADITSLEFMMYNIRQGSSAKGDRLVAILDGDALQVFCIATAASQAVALYQACQRLVQEKRTNYETSLKEVERFMRRRPSVHTGGLTSSVSSKNAAESEVTKAPIRLHTDVVVTLKAVNIGAFPSTFFDHQIFKLEALNAQARFAVAMDDGKIHSGLGMTLGQLRIGLAGVRSPATPKSSGEISVDEVVTSATGSRGGTILKVPKVEAFMETWQEVDLNHIDYIFKSSFEGKVEVGWNYSRISYIREMYNNHSKARAQRLGKPLGPSAVKITGVPELGDDDIGKNNGQQKITAEVTVPQSKYNYTPLEPPIIETPQLRDMGEATPPLEWIGLHRDRLPNLMHQIVIVTLLEVASEVDDAYAKVLGTS